MESPPQAAEPEHWSQYWAAGNLHSCHGAFAQNYGGAIADIWRRFFAGLPVGAAILDVATGNGAIALLARDTSRELHRDFTVTAIDLARIEPERTALARGHDVSGITFLGGRPAEESGFDAASFDAICGQYALEYTDVPRAVAEIARILKPGGRTLFIAHHADSIVLRTTAAELDHLRFLLEECPVLELAREVLTYIGSARTPAEIARLQSDPEAEQRRTAFNEATERVSARIKSGTSTDVLSITLGQLSAAFKARGRLSSEQIVDGLSRYRTELLANRARLTDLARASWTREKLDEVQQLFQREGIRCSEPESVRAADGVLMGWRCEGSKPA